MGDVSGHCILAVRKRIPRPPPSYKSDRLETMSSPKSTTFRHDQSHDLVPAQNDYQHWEHLIRALSHDMSANFMVLESSFTQLSKSIGVCATEELLEQATHVTACLNESRRYLDDLVDLAKTGTVDMEPELIDLRQAIDEVLYAQSDLIRSRNVFLQIEGKLPAIWCNRKRLKQILTNLIRNGVKYGCDVQQPAITISATPSSETMICLKVHDNGPGIPEDSQELIFSPGIRLLNATSDGSGMGLAIVRRIAEHYGGTVQLDSNPIDGTTFFVYLPIPTSAIKRTDSMEEKKRSQKSKTSMIRPAVSKLV